MSQLILFNNIINFRVLFILRKKIHRKKNSIETNEIVKPKKVNKNKKGGGGNYDFDETFNKTVESLNK